MQHITTFALLFFLVGCDLNPAPDPQLQLGEMSPKGVVTAQPTASPAASVPYISVKTLIAQEKASSKAKPLAAKLPPTKSRSAWETLTDFSMLHGVWVHHKNGSSHPGEEINKGGVKVIFSQNLASRTPWNLRFWAPTDGHMSGKTISGGCGFYTELHDTVWYTGFCKGYGLGDKSVELKVILERNYEGDKLRLKIGNLINTTLKKQ